MSSEYLHAIASARSGPMPRKAHMSWVPDRVDIPVPLSPTRAAATMHATASATR